MRDLTPTEDRVLVRLCSGSSTESRELARDLNMALGTLKMHLASIQRKLGTTSRTETVAVAFRRRLVR